MRYCVDKGIPHDVWLSWTAESRSKHLASLLFEAEICQLCGTAEWEWEENRYAYEPEEKFCQGCYMKAVASEGNNNLPGTTTTLVASSEQRSVEKYLREKARARMSFSDDEEAG